MPLPSQHHPIPSGPKRTKGRGRANLHSELTLWSSTALRCQGPGVWTELHHGLSQVSSLQTADPRLGPLSLQLHEPIPHNKSLSIYLYIAYRFCFSGGPQLMRYLFQRTDFQLSLLFIFSLSMEIFLILAIMVYISSSFSKFPNI